ncbi:DUF581 domain-containing protein [Cephalotus follicularis]|uniref:DUF581 domain-containing protein n=1 Tax=Cephalotus follicularis TaxID=3775 RepID=A0A1Q3D286_CEPFO|nr:DUF581 domain-containing protein [Cephalotus follicularis]
MIQRISSPFKLGGGNQEIKMKREGPYTGYASSNKSSAVVGLRILTQISHEKYSNIVVKSALRSSHDHRPSRTHRLLAQSRVSCYLKSCYLCNKKLSLDKDVYMYMGDQGFCSIECRSRQIVLDEMRELETSTNQMLTSYNRHCGNAGRSETRKLLDDLCQGRNPLPRQNHWEAITY